MLVKIYGEDQSKEGKLRYSPAEYTGAEKFIVTGKPNLHHVSTSFVEWQHLTMRISMRRSTRLTNGLSKKNENLEYAVALHFMHYNFCRNHKALRIIPVMEAGIADHV